MGMIYHMLPRSVWADQASDQPYVGDTLATEGFIHCTGDAGLLTQVANHFYRAMPDAFVVLAIDEDTVQAPVKWEEADGHLFPHIYGVLNLDAVRAVRPLLRNAAGEFLPFSPDENV